MGSALDGIGWMGEWIEWTELDLLHWIVLIGRSGLDDLGWSGWIGGSGLDEMNYWMECIGRS